LDPIYVPLFVLIPCNMHNRSDYMISQDQPWSIGTL